MPYKIVKAGNKFNVAKKDSGKVVGTHDTYNQALKHLAALHINVPDAQTTPQPRPPMGNPFTKGNPGKPTH